MAWPGLHPPRLPPSSSSSTMDMKMYEMTEHLRSIQIVQAEQSRRLDEQSYRLHQLEMKELQTNRFESQRYLWGPGAVGDNNNNHNPPSSKTLSGLGFEVFSPSVKEKQSEEGLSIKKEEITTNGISCKYV
jgi:hypothetical protein